MDKLTILICFILFNSFAKAQNIFSALHLNEEREYKTRQPKTIVETNTFYNPGKNQVDMNIKTFDESGMLLMEERFDESEKLTARLTYTNDTANRLTLTRTFERWTQLGYTRETAFYSYDSNYHLVGTTDKDPSGNVKWQTNLVVNEKGHPVELSLFDGDGNPYGMEIATYLYDRNKAVTSVLSNEGKVLSTDTIKISFLNASLFPGENDIYNSNGDLTGWVSRSRNGTVTEYEEEYLYDSFGNCTEVKIYEVTVKNNGKRKRKIDRLFKKQYTY